MGGSQLYRKGNMQENKNLAMSSWRSLAQQTPAQPPVAMLLTVPTGLSPSYLGCQLNCKGKNACNYFIYVLWAKPTSLSIEIIPLSKQKQKIEIQTTKKIKMQNFVNFILQWVIFILNGKKKEVTLCIYM